MNEAHRRWTASRYCENFMAIFQRNAIFLFYTYDENFALIFHMQSWKNCLNRILLWLTRRSRA